MSFDRKAIVGILEEIAMLLELKGENPFKTRAYTNAARAIGTIDGDLEALIRSGEIKQMKGFGKALVEKLTELVETGKLAYLEKLRAEFPDTLLELMRIPGVGPKKVKLFYDELGVKTIADLETACADGRVSDLPGCGAKTAEKILDSIKRLRENQAFFLFVAARAAADEVAAALRQLPQVTRLEVAGSLRRFKEFTKDADIIAASADADAVMAAFVALPQVKEVQVRGETKSSVLLASGMQVDLRVVPDEIFPCALHHFTGSKDHNVAIRSRALKQGLRVSEWGLFELADGEEKARIPIGSESELFARLGLRYVPPELRENLGEIEHAAAAELPELVTTADYRGVLHCHSHASDGANSIDELVVHARQSGHSYLGITDHSKSSFQANGLDEERLAQQIQRIKELRPSLPADFTLFSAIECDIRTDGSLDYADDILAQLDYVIISVHNAFTQPRDEMTARVIRAIEHPASRLLAHPTGRLLLRRPGYEIDLEKVIDAAAANGVAIELNCHPMRLDLDWRLWRRARERGVYCTVNPDAHSLQGFDYIDQGIGFCRKGWLTAEDVINCWPAARLRSFFAGQSG